MENLAVKREVKRKEGMQASEIVLIGILLAIGTVLRAYMPSIGPMTPNLIIGMYCLIIFLLRPKLLEALGISIIAAILCQITSKSPVPYINFISEPIGVLAALALVTIPFDIKIKDYSLKPAIVTFLGTLASGLTYAIVIKSLVLFGGPASNKAFAVFLAVVFTTAIANTIIVQAVYYPVRAALGKKVN